MTVSTKAFNLAMVRLSSLQPWWVLSKCGWVYIDTGGNEKPETSFVLLCSCQPHFRTLSYNDGKPVKSPICTATLCELHLVQLHYSACPCFISKIKVQVLCGWKWNGSSTFASWLIVPCGIWSLYSGKLFQKMNQTHIYTWTPLYLTSSLFRSSSIFLIYRLNSLHLRSSQPNICRDDTASAVFSFAH